MRKLPSFLKLRAKGAALVEYVVLLGLIGVVAIFSLVQFGLNVTNTFDTTNDFIVTEIEDNTDLIIGATPVTPTPGPTSPPGLSGPFVIAIPNPLNVVTGVRSTGGYSASASLYDSFMEYYYSDPATMGIPSLDPIATYCGIEPDPGAPQEEIDAYAACDTQYSDAQNAIFQAYQAAISDLVANLTWTDIVSVDNADDVLGSVTLSGGDIVFGKNPLSYFSGTEPIRDFCGSSPPGLEDSVFATATHPGGTINFEIRATIFDTIC